MEQPKELNKNDLVSLPISLLEEITGILLELPAKSSHRVLNRIEAEVRIIVQPAAPVESEKVDEKKEEPMPKP